MSILFSLLRFECCLYDLFAGSQVLSVYCTSVLCVLYKVFSMYCIMCAVSIIQGVYMTHGSLWHCCVFGQIYDTWLTVRPNLWNVGDFLLLVSLTKSMTCGSLFGPIYDIWLTFTTSYIWTNLWHVAHCLAKSMTRDSLWTCGLFWQIYDNLIAVTLWFIWTVYEMWLTVTITILAEK